MKFIYCHECILWVELTQTDLFKISINHSESCISILGFSNRDRAFSILQVDGEESLDRAILLLNNIETIYRLEGFDKVDTLTTFEEYFHHVEYCVWNQSSLLGSRLDSSGSSCGCGLLCFLFLLSLELHSLNIFIHFSKGITCTGWILWIVLKVTDCAPLY